MYTEAYDNGLTGFEYEKAPKFPNFAYFHRAHGVFGRECAGESGQGTRDTFVAFRQERCDHDRPV
jgi:hypothetical protein